MQRFFEVRLFDRLLPSATKRLFSNFFEGTSLEKYYNVSLTSELKATLEEIDYYKSEIQTCQSKTNGNLKDAIHDKLRFLWTYNSNAIEGSKL
nr:hypothetical protein [Pseudomonadota bacterium]